MKKNSFTFVSAIITLALSGGAATATGCGGLATASLCRDICTCERCTSNDLKACEDQGNKASDAADAAGCSSQFDDAVTCAGAHVSCKDSHAVTDGCEAELAALTKCSSTLSVFGKSVCELAADQMTAKLKGCPKPLSTNPTSGGGTVQCTEALGTILLCQAAAVVNAPCDCIGGGDVSKCTAADSKAFVDAVSLCK
jgi:hypothetical protein